MPRRLLSIVLCFIFFTGCASLSHKKVDPRLERVKVLYNAIQDKEFQKVWDLLLPSSRRNSGRDEYAGQIGNMVEDVKFTYRKPRIVKAGENSISGREYFLADVESTLMYKENGISKSITRCSRSLWVWSEDSWYWIIEGWNCDPSTMNQNYLDFLTY